MFNQMVTNQSEMEPWKVTKSCEMFANIQPKEREMFNQMVTKHVEKFACMVGIFETLDPVIH